MLLHFRSCWNSNPNIHHPPTKPEIIKVRVILYSN